MTESGALPGGDESHWLLKHGKYVATDLVPCDIIDAQKLKFLHFLMSVLMTFSAVTHAALPVYRFPWRLDTRMIICRVMSDIP